MVSGVEVPSGGWYYRLIESYGFERDGGERSIFWRTPMYFSTPGGQAGKQLDEDFSDFRGTRSIITTADVSDRTFLKCTSEGFAFVVKLKPDGELREASVDDLSTWWSGRWTVTRFPSGEPSEDGYLAINIDVYMATLFLEKTSGMLVGPEHKRDGGAAHVYVRIGDINNTSALHSLMKYVPDVIQERAKKAAAAFTA